MWPTVVIAGGLLLAPWGLVFGWLVGARVHDTRGLLGYWTAALVLAVAALAAGGIIR